MFGNKTCLEFQVTDVLLLIIDVIFMGDYSVGFLIRDAETRAVFVKTYDIEPDQFTFLPGTISVSTVVLYK